MYDVDLVQRLLEHFLVQEQSEGSSPSRQSFSDTKMYDGAQRGTNPNAKMRVARLVDSYLTEVSRDRNLSLTKFQVLAEALPNRLELAMMDCTGRLIPILRGRRIPLPAVDSQPQNATRRNSPIVSRRVGDREKDINTLKFELESVKAKYLELQNDMETLQRQFDKVTAKTSVRVDDRVEKAEQAR
ncbi:hypothetical protein DH2020_030014 [Rehmannia glutinosa]|uniref:NPH3 domain-containing protein n=1 Tax=Rehmannia glutinosa TaxID=99300 RepID=A0ABR0VM01_REHGL